MSEDCGLHGPDEDATDLVDCPFCEHYEVGVWTPAPAPAKGGEG